MVMTELCQYLRNWFEKTKFHGDFSIYNGTLTSVAWGALPLLNGQYYRIVGSVLNDGVHKFGDEAETLADEDFSGAVWSMAVPPAVVALAAEIDAWQEKYGNIESQNMSPYSSESFGGYSYTKAQGYASAGGGMLTGWQAVYAARLAPWRKI